MAKQSEPKEMPKNDGIGLNVQSDFVEKSGGEEAKMTNTETEGEGERTTEKKEKKKEEEKEKEEKEKEKNETGGKSKEEREREKEGKKKEKEEGKDWTMKQSKSNSKSQSQNSTQTETVKRDFWANALRTLLIEFRKMHPELIRGGKAKRRTTEQSSNRTKSKTNEEMARKRPGGRGEPSPISD